MASLNLTPPKLGVLGFFEGIDFEARQRATAADIQLKQSQSRAKSLESRFASATFQTRLDQVRANLAQTEQATELGAAKQEAQIALWEANVDIAQQKLDAGTALQGDEIALLQAKAKKEAALALNATATARLRKAQEDAVGKSAATVKDPRFGLDPYLYIENGGYNSGQFNVDTDPLIDINKGRVTPLQSPTDDVSTTLLP